MPLFAKNKPTKRINFEGGWVELQYLSKGVKDEIASRLSSMFAGMDSQAIKRIETDNKEDVPTEMIGIIGKVQEVAYYKLSQAIKDWSESDVDITIDSVKDMDDKVFDMISKEVDSMNSLSKTDEKN
ncbi:hypothetical protein [Bacillus sp. 03113]|uniref:hypothetical protein n=1 Tax=Bacillus sp. 03113 TaxID=2578211 RepID=UPI0011431113|nr:hypothetical protein [Bacillus sp. 03113]